MPIHKRARPGVKMSELTNLVKKFMGEKGGFASYSIAEGSIDADDEDRYELTFHESCSLVTFYRGWTFDELIVPIRSPVFFGILQFLKETDDMMDASTLDPLLRTLGRATSNFSLSSPIRKISVGFRQSKEFVVVSSTR